MVKTDAFFNAHLNNNRLNYCYKILLNHIIVTIIQVMRLLNGCYATKSRCRLRLWLLQQDHNWCQEEKRKSSFCKKNKKNSKPKF